MNISDMLTALFGDKYDFFYPIFGSAVLLIGINLIFTFIFGSISSLWRR